MTSEWRHVPPIWSNNKGLQKTPPRAQFLSYDQLSDSIWRRISRATKLLSRIFKFWKFRKNQKNPQNFIFPKHVPLKNKILKKACNMLDGNGWWICVQNFKSISSKMAELWHKTYWKQPNLPISAIFIFLTGFDFSKSVFGSFFVFFAKSWPKNMYCSAISRMFLGVDLFYRVTWDDLDLYYVQAEC